MKPGTIVAVAAGSFVLVFAAVLGALWADRNLKAAFAPPSLMDSTAPGVNVQLPASRAPFDFTETAKKVTPSVVSVETYQRTSSFFGESQVSRAGSGSGVIISQDGYILTNSHVVQGATLVRVKLSDNRMFQAELVGRDPRSDLALLKVNATGLKPAVYGDSTKLQVGQWVMAVGSPLGYENTVSVGVVSSIGRTLPTESSILVDTIQSDAAINQGNSGGALTTFGGELVGINTAIASMDGGSIGIGFSIPIHRARRVVEELMKYGRARYGSLGVSVDRREGLLSDPRARQELQSITSASGPVPSEGLLILRVGPRTPAGLAGIQRFDVILSLDGKAVKSPLDLEKIMLDKEPGDKMVVKYWSAGTTKEANVTLTDQGV